MNLQTKAALAGLFFGIWPLLMNRSGLSGNVSSLVFTGITMLFLLPVTLFGSIAVTGANWTMAIMAGCAAAVGLLSFNGMLAKASQTEVSSLFLVMILVQIVVPAVYDIYTNGGIETEKLIGFALAAIAAWLLIR